MISHIDPIIAIQNLDKQINRASNTFSEWYESGNDFLEPDWLIESCFFQLLAVVEIFGLVELRNMVHQEYTDAKGVKEGFSASGTDPDGQPYSLVLTRIRCFLRALEHIFLDDEKTTVTKDLFQIIRDMSTPFCNFLNLPI